MTAPVFNRGDLVEKFGGRYGGPGRIVGETEELSDDGYRLYAVAMKVEGGYGEFVHVFPASVLRYPEPPPAPACGLDRPSYHDCPNMKEVGGGFDGERYRCDVCGKGYFLDYEEMK